MSTTLASAVQSLDVEAALTILSTCTWDTLTDLDELVEAYVAACKDSPARTSDYTSFLVALRSSGRLPTIAVPPPDGITGAVATQRNFSSFMDREIFETLRKLLYDDEDLDISPVNPYLIAALVSGSCRAVNLGTCSAQTACVNKGLQLPPYDEEEPSQKEKEIRAIHACLQILLAGKEYKPHTEVADAVRKLKELDVVTSEPGKRLLDATLIHAQEDRPVLSSAEAWSILFP
ncbi:hypothetical protein C8J56DRAFT_812808 [Mycena floridula]|nr:hypothetical protein C8J56DRAFT_812808 [Mycena floridula]